MAHDMFQTALAAVLRHEGGFADHPDDPGGATMMGITRATLAEWRGRPVTRDEVRALSRAEAAAIYRARYWDRIRADELPAGLDLAVFDLAVNSGPGRAVRLLQRVLAVPADGLIGPRTLAAARAADSAASIRALCAARRAFLQSLPAHGVFGRGWARRVAAIEARALALAAGQGRPEGKRQADKNSNSIKEKDTMETTKTILSSRTVWANAVGFAALALSWLGFDVGGLDRDALVENLLQGLAGLGFVLSTIFRVIATRRLI